MSLISESGTDALFADLKRQHSPSRGGDAAQFEFSGDHEHFSPHSPSRNWYVPVKTALEWVLALILFIAAAPLLLLLAILVKITSRGPAFYCQTRLGRRGKTYRIIKLRTMTHNCEQGTGAIWAKKNDPRITRIGKLLRDTHLDELPQLLNVLQGKMSLIGPRPERPELVIRLVIEVPGYRHRLAVKPGVTGLAQMLLPADSDVCGVRRKVAFDLHYIRHISPVMDLRIALCTVSYFVAAAAKASCKLLLGGYGKAVARKWAVAEPVQDELFE